MVPDPEEVVLAERGAGDDSETLFGQSSDCEVALDPTTFAIQRTYPFHAAGPDDIGIAPDGKLWVTLRFREQVAVLDPKSGAYETIDVGRSPHGIFLSSELSRKGPITAETL